jgi:sporulation integral membrane protein YtvI
VPRIYSVLFVVFAIVLLTGLLTMWLVYGLTAEIHTLINEYPAIVKALQLKQQFLLERMSHYQNILPEEFIYNLKEYSNKVNDYIVGMISKTIQVVFVLLKTVPDKLLIYVIVVMYIFFFSMEWPKYKERLKCSISEDLWKKTSQIVNDTKIGIVGYLKAQLIIALISGLIILIGLLLIKSQFVLIITIMCIFASFIPFLGVNIVLVPWAIYSAFFCLESFALELIAIMVTVSVVRHIIEPKILGDKLGIQPIGILVALFIGFELVGFWGLILGPLGLIVFNSMVKSGLLGSLLIDK